VGLLMAFWFLGRIPGHCHLGEEESKDPKRIVPAATMIASSDIGCVLPSSRGIRGRQGPTQGRWNVLRLETIPTAVATTRGN